MVYYRTTHWLGSVLAQVVSATATCDPEHKLDCHIIGHSIRSTAMTRFNHCPNCRTKPESGLFGGPYRKIYQYGRCGTLYCDHSKCGGGRCPNCGATDRSEAGKCHA